VCSIKTSEKYNLHTKKCNKKDTESKHSKENLEDGNRWRTKFKRKNSRDNIKQIISKQEREMEMGKFIESKHMNWYT